MIPKNRTAMELLQRLHTFIAPETHLFPRKSPGRRPGDFIRQVKEIGIDPHLGDYERRKLGIFNLLNFFQLLTGLILPLSGFFLVNKMPWSAWIMSAIPALVSLGTLYLNSRKLHQAAQFFYFLVCPIFTSIVYLNGFNLGVEMSFVMYGILSVFFLQDIGYMAFSVGLSMISYFVLAVVLKEYHYQLRSINAYVYVVNQAIAIGYVFYGLYLVKTENSGYQASIIRQQEELKMQAARLEQQAGELAELNQLNNKLFSVIAHDLKSPMYALRNFFVNARELNLPAKEIRGMLPEVINDLNYTTGLMDNLLQWAKSQLQMDAVRPSLLDLNKLVTDNINLLRIQADAKNIRLERDTPEPVTAWADRDMINLVVRNLLSNAIKFSAPGDVIVIGMQATGSLAELYVKDNGRGISAENLRKIQQSVFYTTNGTAKESGTGLGLMLCREFLNRNEGRMMIESEPGVGSTFSFCLPMTERST